MDTNHQKLLHYHPLINSTAYVDSDILKWSAAHAQMPMLASLLPVTHRGSHSLLPLVVLRVEEPASAL